MTPKIIATPDDSRDPFESEKAKDSAESAPYVNDAVDLDNDFGTWRVGDQIARMALEAATPFTLGVAGKWGVGKTSVLRRGFCTLGGRAIQVEVPFGREPKEEDRWNEWSSDWHSRREELRWGGELFDVVESSLCVWFSPWQHQGAANPLLPLLLEIRDQFSVRAKAPGVVRQFALAGVTLLERLIDGALVVTGTTKRPIATGTTEAVGKAWEEANRDLQVDDGQRFQLLFEDAVDTVLGSLEKEQDKERDGNPNVRQLEGAPPKGRLIVFIDDLDRCEESAVVELLEAIKLYLSAPNCVFILGIDEAAVLSALKRHWPGRSEDDNREYLEKLFQAVVPVPQPAPAKAKEWIEKQLGRHDFAHRAACAQMVVDLIEGNPRKIKNFVNSLCATWRLHGLPRAKGLADAERSKLERRMVLVGYLRQNHKPIWRLLERDGRILRIVTRVLATGDPPEYVDKDLLDGDFDPYDQEVLRRFIRRHFVHVLGKEVTDEPALSSALSALKEIPPGKAVKLLGKRLDRKRSDQKFIFHYKKLFVWDDDLPEEFLFLPDLRAEEAES